MKFTYFALSGFSVFSQSLLCLFGKRKHYLKLYFSFCNERRIIKLDCEKNAAVFIRGNPVLVRPYIKNDVNSLGGFHAAVPFHSASPSNFCHLWF